MYFSFSGKCHWKAPASYLSIAENLSQGRGFVDNQSNFGVPDRTRRPPLIPAIIAVAMKIFGKNGHAAFLVFQALLGSITALIIAWWGRELSGSKGIFYFLLAVCTFWAPAMRLAPCAMTEVVFIFLFSAFCTLLYFAFRSPGRWLFAGAGLLLGTASLARPVLYPVYFLLAAGWPWLFSSKSGIRRKEKVIAAAAFFGTLILVITPWCFRNSVINQHPTLITSSVGLNLFMENTEKQRPEIWNELNEKSQPGGELHGLSEGDRDRLLMHRATKAIFENPAIFIGRFFERVILLYNNTDYNFPPLPYNLQWSNKWAILLFIGLFLLFKSRFNEGLLLAIIQLNFIIVYGLTFFEARFREAVMPVHLVLACCGGLFIIRKIKTYIKGRKSVQRGA